MVFVHLFKYLRLIFVSSVVYILTIKLQFEGDNNIFVHLFATAKTYKFENFNENHQTFKSICKQSIFKKLLYKLTEECIVSITGRFHKQIDGVAMGGTLSVILSDCFKNKMEKDVFIPLKLK